MARSRDLRRRARRSSLDRWKASWWVVLPLFPLGLLGWGAFFYAGTRARRRLWTAFAGLYLVLLVVGFSLAQAPEDSAADDVAGGLLLFTWAAMVVHALVIRPAYLERMELVEGPLDEAEDALLERQEARRIADGDPGRALELGIGRPDLEGAFDGGLVDVNNASAKAIAGLPGVDDELARRIVAVRDEIHGFSSLEDLGHVLDLPAPTLDRMRSRAVCLPRSLPR